ncbi:hypothetical protein [Terricaulis sp.]|uniref:hypothetical protein n=1 Tax=Terricaulis sp. TaxID=2768686 RepID=UPI0037840F97
MSVFEHLLTLGSFVLALGIGTILTFAASLFQRRREVRFSVAHLLWMLVIFAGQIAFWLGAYMFSGVAHSSFPAIAFVIAQPILFFLQSAFVAPGGADTLDLQAFHQSNGRSYMAMFLLTLATQLAFMMHVAAVNPALHLNDFFVSQGAALAVTLLALLLRWRWVQVVAPAVLLVHQAIGLYFAALPLVG